MFSLFLLILHEFFVLYLVMKQLFQILDFEQLHLFLFELLLALLQVLLNLVELYKNEDVLLNLLHQLSQSLYPVRNDLKYNDLIILQLLQLLHL